MSKPVHPNRSRNRRGAGTFVCDEGGDGGDDQAYSRNPALGVWTFDQSGLWVDVSGTSFSAPLLAREAAFAFDELRKFCEPEARIFGCTVKAFLAMTAESPTVPSEFLE